MVRLLTEIVFAVLMILILGVGSEKLIREKRDIFTRMTLDDFFATFCKNNPFADYIPMCDSYKTTTASPSGSTAPSKPSTSSSPSVSNPEDAPWCQFLNGTTIPLGYIFMHGDCDLCQCTQSREIICSTHDCMPTYCIDNSAPMTRKDQCCAQCAYEQNPTACTISGFTFPHGTIIRKTKGGMLCWCQLGSIECRKYTSSLYSSLDLWGEGTAVYIIVIIICAMLFVGTLLCSAGALFFYYFYKRNQQSVQQAYEQYYNNAGWQPMGDEAVVDPNAEEKRTEAEQNEYQTASSEQHIPPPYALYNGSYKNQPIEKDEK